MNQAQQLSEKEILEIIFSDKQSIVNTLNFFRTHIISYKKGVQEGFYYFLNLKRERINLSSGQKPGDIDIFGIPFREDSILFSKSFGIEVKIVRPTVKKPSKSPNSFGISQTNGLIKDEFPFVGLLHIVINEESPQKYHWEIPHMDKKLQDGKFKKIDSFQFDPFDLFASQNQTNKLKSMDINPQVGFRSIGVGFQKGKINSSTFNDFKEPDPNKKISQNLVHEIQNFYSTHSELFKKFCWYG